MLFLPGAVKLKLFDYTYNVKFERTDASSLFTFRVVDSIPGIDIPKGEFIPIYGNHTVNIVKQILDAPEKYYVSSDRNFITLQPEYIEDYIAI